MLEPAPDVERVFVAHVKGSLRLHPHPFGARHVCAPLRPPVQPLTHRYTAPCLHPSRPFKGVPLCGGIATWGGESASKLAAQAGQDGGECNSPADWPCTPSGVPCMAVVTTELSTTHRLLLLIKD